MLTNKDAGMSEPPKAVSFQRPVNSEKHKGAQRAGAVGVPFWFVLGQAKMNIKKKFYKLHKLSTY
jgi:hypothetical protein